MRVVPAAATYMSPLAEDATAALRHAFADPHDSVAMAETTLAAARAAGDIAATSLALQALGLSARLRGNVQPAITYLADAVRTAEMGGLAERAAEARLSLGFALSMAGQNQAALDALDVAAQVLTAGARGQLEVQRAIVLRRLGRVDEALQGLRRALPVLRRAADTLWEARALSQRGLIQVEQGSFVAGEADLRRCQELFASRGDYLDAAKNRHNRGWCAARAGNVVAALGHYDTAERELAGLGMVGLGEVSLDRARLLLSVGLAGDALSLATRAAESYALSRDQAGWAEAMLTAADAAQVDGDHAAAVSRASDARRAFAKQRRPGWVALARHTEARARWSAGARSPALLRAAQITLANFERLGHPVLAGDAALVVGRVALALGRPAVARTALERVSRGRLRGTADQRTQGWLAEALLRLADGNSRGAQAALRAGMVVVDRYCVGLGATEFRAHASASGAELASLGLRLAVKGGRPSQVLAWTERWRAGSLRTRPVRPPDNTAVAAALAELRVVASEIGARAATGGSSGPLLRRQEQLEDTVRRLTQRTSGRTATGGADNAAPTVGELAEELGDRALVEMIKIDGTLHAVVLAGGRARFRHLGSWLEVSAEIDNARFALRRLAAGQGSLASQDAARACLVHAGRRLDEVMLGSVRPEVGDRPLVVVPPGSLHALPWALLPSCRDRPVSVSPSAFHWLRAVRARPPARAKVVLVAGPGLPGAKEELAALSSLYRAAYCLSGDEATASATVAALDGASLAHVACHGTFRADNPLFSSLNLADGPVTVYDLEALTRVPHHIVLSACDSGLSGVRPGDELMGLAASLCCLGTSAMIVSVVPVPDSATTPLMVSLHRRIQAGEALAAALAGARCDIDENDGASLAAGSAFICIGAG